jgi:DNA replication protein DnaC
VSRAGIVADVIRIQARQLKMPGLARAFSDLARQAREEHWTHEDYLHDVLAVEIASRSESAVKQRIHGAGFPELKTLDEFDFAIAEGVAAAKIAELAKGDWIGAGENVLLVGPIGTGKTHLAIALGIEAARQRRRV